MKSFLSGLRKDGGAAPSVEVAEARTLAAQGAQLIDVREAAEFRAGHAQGARNIPLGELPARLAEIDRARTVLTICQIGVRSASAQAALIKQSFADVRNVNGGTAAWKKAGMPLEKD